MFITVCDYCCVLLLYQSIWKILSELMTLLLKYVKVIRFLISNASAKILFLLAIPPQNKIFISRL